MAVFINIIKKCWKLLTAAMVIMLMIIVTIPLGNHLLRLGKSVGTIQTLTNAVIIYNNGSQQFILAMFLMIGSLTVIAISSVYFVIEASIQISNWEPKGKKEKR